VKEFVPRLLEKDILKLCEIIMTKIGFFISTKVYEFLNNKYTLVEAKNNVLSLIGKQLSSNNYYSDLEKFKTELLQIIKSEISEIKSINEETANILIDEFWNIFKNNFDSLLFFPANYYSIDFRKADDKRDSEKEFSNVIDFYLIENDGTPWDMPVETYAVEFTQETKEKIFEVITNGFVNPNFTLTDYLFLYK
jgi:archaellum component FlaF (FlaF/FlaG flagellin family)